MTKPAALYKLGSHVTEVTRKMWEAMYPVNLFHNVDLRVFVDGHELTHIESS